MLAQDCIKMLTAAALTQGYTELAACLPPFISATPSALPKLLATFSTALVKSFFPRYSHWFLCYATALLLLPGAAAQHLPVLLILRAVFETEEMEVNPGAAQLLADSSLLTPLVGLSQVRRWWDILHHCFHIAWLLAAGAYLGVNPGTWHKTCSAFGCAPCGGLLGKIVGSCSATRSESREVWVRVFW